MEKLELKHLASYLPYGLKYIDKDTKKIEKMRSLHDEIGMVDFGWGNAHEFKEFKPILRPLSDLHREKQIAEYFCSFIEHFKRLTINDHFLDWSEIDTEKHVLDYPYNVIEMLIEWHFDVFGLIDKGLAIDINTL